MYKIKTIICDDEESLCNGYKLFLDTAFDAIECVAVAYNSVSCLEKTKELQPDLLLLDIQLEHESSGIDIIPKINFFSPETKIIMLTSHLEDKYVFQSVVNGANGYVSKQIDCSKMFNEILKIYNNLNSSEIDLSSEQVATFKREASSIYNNKKSLLYMMNNMVKLSASEYEILQEIYKGYTYKKIAEKRVVEECTIKSTASRIKKKLGFTTMKELISWLKELQYFEQL